MPEGCRFSWDAVAKRGECCGGLSGVECEYRCYCQAKESEIPEKPSACTLGAPGKDNTPAQVAPGPSALTCMLTFHLFMSHRSCY